MQRLVESDLKEKTKHVSYYLYIILQDSFETSNKETMARPVFEKSVFVCGPILKYYYLNMEVGNMLCFCMDLSIVCMYVGMYFCLYTFTNG